MNRKLVALYSVREASGLVVMGVALFWSAGRLDWWAAWAAMAVMLGWILGTAYVIGRLHPDLLAERLGARRGAKAWDAAILGVLALTQLVRYVVAGLDHRRGWTAGIPIPAEALALVACAVGYGLVVWATASNRFFSQVVRVQSERGHQVERGGPYGLVRHPAYAGALLYELAVPVLLGSWWAAFPSLVAAGLVVLRTALEDRTLEAELDGYADYAQQVRYRLVPGLW